MGNAESVAALKARKEHRMKRLAELMADGYELKDAAPIIGVSLDRTRRLWRIIRRETI